MPYPNSLDSQLPLQCPQVRGILGVSLWAGPFGEQGKSSPWNLATCGGTEGWQEGGAGGLTQEGPLLWRQDPPLWSLTPFLATPSNKRPAEAVFLLPTPETAMPHGPGLGAGLG